MSHLELDPRLLAAVPDRLRIVGDTGAVVDLHVLVPGQLLVVLWGFLHTGHVLPNVLDGNLACLDMGRRLDLKGVLTGAARGCLQDVLDKEALTLLELTPVSMVPGGHHWVGSEERVWGEKNLEIYNGLTNSPNTFL